MYRYRHIHMDPDVVMVTDIEIDIFKERLTKAHASLHSTAMWYENGMEVLRQTTGLRVVHMQAASIYVVVRTIQTAPHAACND